LTNTRGLKIQIPKSYFIIVPGTARLGLFARLLGPLLFFDGKGQAWLKHNIEEMGNLENFLPELYEREAKHEPGRERLARSKRARLRMGPS
jgi:hypothetical protein